MLDPARLRRLNERPVNQGGDYVLYWMIAARRTRWNPSLEHAVALAEQLERPLVVLEPLRIGYRWASDRMHAFVLQGMADNREALAGRRVLYYPYVEPEEGAGRGLLEALAGNACAIVTDHFPCFFLPRMVAAAARKVDVAMEAVDGLGLLPLSISPKPFTTAFSYRSFFQKKLLEHLHLTPLADPLEGSELVAPDEIPKAITARWPSAGDALLEGTVEELSSFSIDHDVPPAELRGGAQAGETRLREFVDERLAGYGEDRNEPGLQATSGLSPWLHFGHLSAHEVFASVTSAVGWTPDDLGEDTRGKRSGWWGVDESTEGFLDQITTWREVGHHFAEHVAHLDEYETLPDWALETLGDHASDPREYTYSRAQFEAAETHDEVWNAAQRQLRREGVVHNYLRMVWGKMILGWSASPRKALATMVELNNRWALDGRDPNSYSGIFWTLGRFDRAWGPERPVFGKVRYMTTANTRRKLNLGPYLDKYGATTQAAELFDG